MKGCLAVAVVLCLLSPSSAAVTNGVIHRVGARFGPDQCVSVTRSSEGCCVIALDCQGLDTSQTEFAFDCVGKNIVRHSFGVGGFDADEEYDTGKKCDLCNAPVPVDATVPGKVVAKLVAATEPVAKLIAKPVQMVQPPKLARADAGARPPKLTLAKPDAKTTEPHSKVTRGVIKHVKPVKPVKLHVKVKHSSNTQVWQESAGTKAIPPGKDRASFKIWGSSTPEEKMQKRKSLRSSPEIVRYGPNACVSVYKSPENHCIMSTSCGGSNMLNYEYGLVCVDGVGLPVKHLFGKDSFDSEESFDTLIRCNECLGLEDVPGGVALAGEVSILSQAISGLTAAVTNISMNVQRLNAEVFRATTASSPAPAAALPTAAAAPTKLLHKSSAHHRHSKTKKRLRHVEQPDRHSKTKKHLRHVEQSGTHSKKKKHLRQSNFRHHAYHVSRHAAESDDDLDDADGVD